MGGIRAAALAAACCVLCVSGAALAADPAPGAKVADGAVFVGALGAVKLYTQPADPKPLSWTSAKEFCEQLDAAGHKDWALPSDGELELLYKNQKAIGGFKAIDYASGEISATVSTRDFSSGYVGEARSWDVLAFRCVRHG